MLHPFRITEYLWLSPYDCAHFYVKPENGKWTPIINWITLDLLMKKPFHLFKTKIMMIKIHRIQAV